MNNYFKKIISLVPHQVVKKEKTPLTILFVWQIELIIIGLLFCFVVFANIWVYRKMVSNKIEISPDKIGEIKTLNKQIISKGGVIIKEREKTLNNPLFPLTKNPF